MKQKDQTLKFISYYRTASSEFTIQQQKLQRYVKELVKKGDDIRILKRLFQPFDSLIVVPPQLSFVLFDFFNKCVTSYCDDVTPKYGMVILHLLILLSKDLQYFENLVTCVYKLTIRVLTFVDSQDCHVPDYFIHLQDFLCVVLQLDEFSDLGTDSLLSLVELINLVPDFVQLNGATLYRIFKQVAQLDLTSPVINNIIANQCLNTDFEKLFGRYEKPKIFKLYYSDIVVDMANRLITLFQNSGKCEYNICLYYLLKNNPFDTSFLISYYLQDQLIKQDIVQRGYVHVVEYWGLLVLNCQDQEILIELGLFLKFENLICEFSDVQLDYKQIEDLQKILNQFCCLNYEQQQLLYGD